MLFLLAVADLLVVLVVVPAVVAGKTGGIVGEEVEEHMEVVPDAGVLPVAAAEENGVQRLVETAVATRAFVNAEPRPEDVVQADDSGGLFFDVVCPNFKMLVQMRQILNFMKFTLFALMS